MRGAALLTTPRVCGAFVVGQAGTDLPQELYRFGVPGVVEGLRVRIEPNKKRLEYVVAGLDTGDFGQLLRLQFICGPVADYCICVAACSGVLLYAADSLVYALFKR